MLLLNNIGDIINQMEHLEAHMEYEDILKYVKRYSFSSKMEACLKYSRQNMTPLGIISVQEMRKGFLPWELETFALFAIDTKEYNDLDVLEKGGRRFVEIMNAIRLHKKTENLRNSGTKELLTEFLLRTGLTQFDLQEVQDYKYFRYNYFFNYVNKAESIDIKRDFIEKFGTDYNKIMQLGISLNIALCSKDLTRNLFKLIINYFGKAYEPLTIAREEYKRLLKIYANSPDDYEFCVRPSYSYSFISDNDGNIYLPLPHLLYRATTSSLLYRLTENNTSLREKIGRYVVESYLLRILKSARNYDEVLPENTYYISKRKCKTPDICIKSNMSFLFIESKSSVPPMTIRLIHQETNKKYVEIMAASINQLYKQMKFFLKGKFYFFSTDNVSPIDSNNVWGIVSLLEDSFILREIIYKKFAELAGISVDGEEYSWVIHHIKIVSLYDIEKNVFIGNNLIDELARKERINQPYDFALADIEGRGIENQDVTEFMDNIRQNIDVMLDSLE
jgi:hypothetical protein